MKLFVTGFGAFSTFQDNPSAYLAKNCGLPHRVLEVSYAAVDEFLENLDLSEFDGLLSLGLAAGTAVYRLEMIGRNTIGQALDVRGVAGPSKIGLGPHQLSSSLWEGLQPLDGFEWSTSAGDYLCNYILYRALERFPEKRIGFLHIPPPETIPLDRQLQDFRALLATLGALP